MQKQPRDHLNRIYSIAVFTLLCLAPSAVPAAVPTAVPKPTEPASQLRLALQQTEDTDSAPNRSYTLIISNGSSWPMSLRLKLEATDLFRLEPLQAQPFSVQPGQSTALYRLKLKQPGRLDQGLQPYLQSITGSLEPASNQPLQLPCACGTPCSVSQASMGDSHRGWQRHAVDFYLPERSPVHAVSDGLVVEVRQDSDRTCSRYRPECDEWANSITVRTPEGGLLEYAHLSYRGALVDEGQTVQAGDLLALSGNTGYSLGPHLHLALLGVDLDLQRQTFAMTFEHHMGTGLLQEGRSYRRIDCPKDPASLLPSSTRGEPPA
jgi:murein DD-endopeptidase MepM/ murein hydrolase activator NlpD